MEDRVAQLEVRLEAIQGELSTIDTALDRLKDDLSHSPEESGWRSLKNDIATVRWRAVTAPRLARIALYVMLACGLAAAGLWGAMQAKML